MSAPCTSRSPSAPSDTVIGSVSDARVVTLRRPLFAWARGANGCAIAVDAATDIFVIILIIERRAAMCPHATRECKLQLARLKFRVEKRIAQAEKMSDAHC
jgi:hypothetical protein